MILKNLLISLLLLITQFSYSQCACVWKDAAGVVQCQLYSNCSGPNLSNCASKVTGGTMCPCTVYPGMNFICGGCQSNGACWYNGTSCLASQVCTLIALPIELINFEGIKENGKNIISWKTASESNCSHYFLQQSSDGVTFKTLLMIPGSGNSSSEISYVVSHEDPEKIINYYQLIQVDFDGEYEAFDIISIDNRERSNEPIRITNMLGQDIHPEYEGLIILYFEDGTTKKVFKYLPN